MIEQLFSSEVIYALGWTLVHTLWQGALFAILLALLLVVLRTYSAQARYLVAVGLLAGFFLTTIFTFTQVYREADQAVITDHQVTIQVVLAIADRQEAAGEESLLTAASTPVTSGRPQEMANAVSFQDRMVNYYNTHLPLIVTIWLMGVLVLLLRMLGQLAYVQRLKSYGTAHFPAAWMDRLRELETRLDMKRPVQYLLSRRTHSPMTFGFLRPVVLFPADLVKELKDTQIYAILAHELAHIKRDDFLVNLIQQLLITLFFYHPGLWWMSARIEEEREHSCDDLAIRITEQPIGYAKTLIQIKENQMKQMSLSMAFTGANRSAKSGFQNRITRLLSNSFAKATYGEGIITALILVMVLAVAVGATGPSPNNALLAADKEANPSHLAEAEKDPQNEGSAFTMSTFDDNNHTDTWGEAEADFSEAGDATFESSAEEGVTNVKSDFDLFMEAIDDGNLKLVKYFLDKGMDVNLVNDRGFTPLMLAASEDHPEIIRLLIDHGADINYVNRDGLSAIAEAADEGSYASAVVLLDAGANVSLSGHDNGRAAVALAASEGHLDVLELLLDAGADLEGKSGALHAAAEEGKLDVVRFLLEEGVKINQLDEYGRTALSYAAEENQPDVVRLLLRKGADPGLVDQQNRSALDYAANEDADQSVAQLLDTEEGRQRIKNNPTLLIEASDEGALSVVRRLVEAGADVNLRNEEGYTALMAAANEGEIAVADYLLEQGAKVNAANLRGAWTALHFAADEEEPNMIHLLLENGAKIEARCDYRSTSINSSKSRENTISYYKGATALFVAIEEGNLESIRALLRNKADVNVKVAKRYFIIPDSYNQFEAYKIDPDARGANLKAVYETQSWTPLMEAVEASNYRLVDMLLNAGAKVDAQTEKGMTALSIAQKMGDTRIMNRLKEN